MPALFQNTEESSAIEVSMNNNPKINLNAFLILVAAISTCAQNHITTESSDNDQLSTIITLSFLSIPMIVFCMGTLRLLCRPVPRPTDGITPQGSPNPDDLSIPSFRSSSFSLYERSHSFSPNNESRQSSPNHSQFGYEEPNLPHP